MTMTYRTAVVMCNKNDPGMTVVTCDSLSVTCCLVVVVRGARATDVGLTDVKAAPQIWGVLSDTGTISSEDIVPVSDSSEVARLSLPFKIDGELPAVVADGLRDAGAGAGAVAGWWVTGAMPEPCRYDQTAASAIRRGVLQPQ